jgi:hypothetical protein
MSRNSRPRALGELDEEATFAIEVAAEHLFPRTAGAAMTPKLFAPAEVTSAYLKMGLMGFAGSGKTYTATAPSVTNGW